jgi:hypothetical protein
MKFWYRYGVLRKVGTWDSQVSLLDRTRGPTRTYFGVSAAFAHATVARVDFGSLTRARKIPVAASDFPSALYPDPADKHLDEEVAPLHLEHLVVKLTTFTKEQANYIGVLVQGLHKAEHYRTESFWVGFGPIDGRRGVAAPPVFCTAYVPDFVIGVTTNLRSPTCE